MLVNKPVILRYLGVQASSKCVVLCATSDWVTDRRMQRIAKAYIKKGYRVIILGCKRPNSEPFTLFGADSINRIEVLPQKGLKFYAAFNWQLFWVLMRTKAHTIYAADADTLPACFLASRIKGTMLIYDAHEWFSQVPELKNKPKVRFFWDWIERAFAMNADQVFTVAPLLGQLLSNRLGGREVKVISNYPNHWNVSQNQIDRQNPFIVYLGVLNEGRGIELAIEAIAQLPISLKIIGSGDLDTALKHQVKSMPLGKVQFLGKLQPAEIQAACKGAMAGLMLLDDSISLSYKYSLANKFFDYVQMGLPVLANLLPEYERLNQQHQVLIPVAQYSAQALENSLRQILQEPQLLTKAQQACWEAAKHWVWKDDLLPDLP